MTVYSKSMQPIGYVMKKGTNIGILQGRTPDNQYLQVIDIKGKQMLVNAKSVTLRQV